MYKLTQDGVRRSDGACIPNDPTNRDWEEYTVWLALGNIPDPEFTDAELTAQKADNERQWRNSELPKADIEIYKMEDAADTTLELTWRSYRIALRDYPQQPEFPNGIRPVAPGV